MAEKTNSKAVITELNKEIKAGCPAPAYLLYGDEPFLINFYKNSVCKCIADPDDTMNSQVFSGKDIDIPSLIASADTLPFFKDRRLILVEESGFFGSSCDDLADYLKNPCPSTTFVFSEYGVEKKTAVKATTRMFKAVSKIGKCFKLDPMAEDDIIDWVARYLAKRGRKIRLESVRRLCKRSGSDMNQLKQELDKLISYTDDRESIEDADIDAICTHTAADKIFDMMGAIISKNPAQAFTLYYDLLTLKTSPVYILIMIAREYSLMLQIKEMQGSNRTANEMISALRQPPWKINKYSQKTARYSSTYLRRALDECLELDKNVKSGLIAGELAVEIFISKYSK